MSRSGSTIVGPKDKAGPSEGDPEAPLWFGLSALDVRFLRSIQREYLLRFHKRIAARKILGAAVHALRLQLGLTVLKYPRAYAELHRLAKELKS